MFRFYVFVLISLVLGSLSAICETAGTKKGRFLCGIL